MTTNSGEYKYAQVVGEQYNPNYDADKTRWRNLSNAVGSDQRTWGMCYYSKKGSDTLVPTTLAAHDFKMDIPKNAYVKSVTLEVSLRVANPALQVEAPYVAFMIYGSNIDIPSDTQWGETGWVYGGGDYAVNLKDSVSTSEKIFSYTIPESELSKKKFPAKSFNENAMGADIHFKQPTRFDGTNIAIYINWVRIKIDYSMPQTYLRWGSDMWDSENPYALKLNHRYRIPLLYGNKSKASAGHDQVVDIQLPFGTHMEDGDWECTDGHSWLEPIDPYFGKYRWHVDGGINAENFINMFIYTDTHGFKTFTATNMGKSVDGYISVQGGSEQYSDAHISSGDVQKLTTSCFYFKTKVISDDSSIIYDVIVDGEEQADPSEISQTFKDYYNNPSGEGNYLIGWNLSADSQAVGISIDEENTDANHIAFNIPRAEPVEIEWTGCFMIVTEGMNTLKLIENDLGHEFEHQYKSYDTNGVNARFIIDDTTWYDHRILTELDLEGIVIPFAVKDTDRYMVEGDCSLKMRIQKHLAYVGCVPLKFSHHDPKSDFENKTVKETYRNNIYTGKTGEIDEKITCELHLPPQDWTTLQGLCELDKPVPVNAVPQAFEGDVLNHRGWVELGGVNNVQKTNPLYYKGELDFEYITHNINTRFQIAKGMSVSPYDTQVLKDFMDYVCESGDEFADYTYTNEDGMIVHNRTGYFNVETDGTYIYDKDNEPNRRTLMTMDNSQKINIKSVSALAESNRISFEWNSTKIPEDRENNVERIVRIVDKDGLILLEYKYFDYTFDTVNNVYACRVNCSVLNKSIGSFETVIDTTMFLSNDIESLNLVQDVNGNIVQEEEPTVIDMMPDTDIIYHDPVTDEDVEISADPFTYNDYIYGTKLHFTLVGNVLNILDEGYTGKEVSRNSITLEKAEYYYEVEFTNKNVDGDTNDILHFMDFEVQETILTTDLKQLYSDMVVSSFPIPHKTLLFTRTSEEGMLYYYQNEETPFTYIQEPFYMYWNGVDLKSSAGSSLFNLNNSYTIFYLQNGLVKLGFNRINGALYLYKYDQYSDSYIRVSTLQLTEYTDFDVGVLSDDKIEVKVGKTVFTMYRGYPYVVVKHSVDDIEFRDKFNKVYAEGINGVNVDFPVMWDLVNSDNLLPSCITGDDIKASCLDVETIYNEDVSTEPTLSLTKVSPSTVKNEDTVIFEVAGNVSNVDEEIDISDDYSGGFGEYSSTEYDANGHRIAIDIPYVITDTSAKLVVELVTTLKTTSSLKLDVYVEGSGTPITYNVRSTETFEDGNKLVTFNDVLHSRFADGAILKRFVVRLEGIHDLFDLNEHVSVLVDGDESYVGKVASGEPVYDDLGNLVMVPELKTNKFALIFKDNQPHTVQAVYKGNTEIGVAISNPLMITPVQPSDGGTGVYLLTQEVPTELKYLETPRFKWKLTQNGSPVYGEIIERVLPNTIWTATTNRNGEVVGIGSNLDILYQWTPGEYKIGATYWKYEGGQKTQILAECWDTIKVVKNTPTLTFIKAGEKGKTAEFQLTDPLGKAMPNQTIIISVGSQVYTKTTDSLGKAYLRINRNGYFRYKATFNGNDYFNPVSRTDEERIGGN